MVWLDFWMENCKPWKGELVAIAPKDYDNNPVKTVKASV